MELSVSSPAMVTYGMQADYACLLQGAAAFALAAICFLRASSPDGKKIWNRLVLFAFLQGTAALLGIFSWSVPRSYPLAPWIAGCELLSYGAILKPIRDFWTAGKSAGLGKKNPWPSFLPVWVGLECALQLAIWTIPGMTEAVLLPGAAPVTWGQAAEIGLLLGMIGSCAPDASARNTGLSLRRGTRLKLLAAFLTLFFAGWLATGYIARDTDEELRGYLRSRTEIAAVSIRPELMGRFERFAATGDRQSYRYVSPELRQIQRTSPEIKGLYVVVRQGGELVFAYSSQDDESAGGEAGRIYRRYPPELLRTYLQGQAATAGPYTDEWGSFVSGFAAVKNPDDGGTVAVLGLDMAAEDWIRTIFRHRLAPICVTLLLFLIGTLYFASRQRLLAAMEQTSASEERFALAMQGANDGLWDWNVVTGEVYFSPQWKRMLGLPPDEPETDLRQWAELLHPEDRDGALAQLRAYLQGRVERLEYEVRMRHRDGHYIDVLARAFAVRRDAKSRPFRVVGTQVDISEKNAAARELKLAKEAAEQAAKIRSAFLANMSHEIRTPIHAILGFTQLMQQDANLTQEQRGYMATIRRNGGYLLAVINEVLEMSKLEAAKIELHLETFVLPELLSEADSLFAGQLQEKALRFSCSGLDQLPRYVSADKQKLRQILVNLLGNAVKFTEAGSIQVTVRMEIENQDKTAGCLIWEVRDSGPGIALEEQERIFQPFIQAQAETGRKTGGTGLGLAISREYARLMGGDIFLVSRKGSGSLFRLEAPVRIEGDRPAAAAPQTVSSSAPARNLPDSASAETTRLREDLPDGFAAEFCDAVLRARIDECEVLTERLRKICPLTAERLKEHLQRYEYGKILAMLQDGRENSG